MVTPLDRRAVLAGAAAMAATGARAQGASTAQGSSTQPAPTIPGPDPNLRIPSFKLPPRTCDTHTHIFGPHAQYPYADKRPYTPPDAGLAAFRAMHDTLGIARAVIVNATVHGFDNRVVTDAIAQSGGRYLGVANVNERMTDRELAALDAAGIRGCRFTFLARLGGRPDLSELERLAPRLAALGWHVDLYVEAPALPELIPVFSRLPLPYVLDHMCVAKASDGPGQPGFKALVDLARRDEKCWVKLTGAERVSATGAPFRDAVPFARALVEAAPDRVLWGTDWPHPNVPTMPNDGDLVDLVPLYAPDEAIRHKLLVDNPAKLYRFPA